MDQLEQGRMILERLQSMGRGPSVGARMKGSAKVPPQRFSMVEPHAFRYPKDKTKLAVYMVVLLFVLLSSTSITHAFWEMVEEVSKDTRLSGWARVGLHTAFAVLTTAIFGLAGLTLSRIEEREAQEYERLRAEAMAKDEEARDQEEHPRVYTMRRRAAAKPVPVGEPGTAQDTVPRPISMPPPQRQGQIPGRRSQSGTLQSQRTAPPPTAGRVSVGFSVPTSRDPQSVFSLQGSFGRAASGDTGHGSTSGAAGSSGYNF